MSTGRKKKTGKKAGPRVVQSVDRALTMLKTLVAEPVGLSLSDLASRSGLAVQTAQGLVRTLQHHGLVVQQGRATPYTIGPGLAGLSRTWHAVQDRAGLARPAVANLAHRLGEYVILVELRGEAIFALVEARSDRELAVAYEHCSVERMHVMATGKVLLAELGGTQRKEILDRLSLKKYARQAITTRKRLFKELVTVKTQGWARCREEGSEGIAALGVPVRDAGGKLVAALGSSMPVSRLTTPREKEVLKELTLTARQIEEAW